MFPLEGVKSPSGLFGTWKVNLPISCPIGMGLGKDLALAVGEGMAPSGLWSVTERKGVTRTSPCYESDWWRESGSQGICSSVGCSGIGGRLLEIPGRNKEAGAA